MNNNTLSLITQTLKEFRIPSYRIKEDSRAQRESLNNRIRQIQAYGTAADELSKTQPSKIAKLRKQGENAEADGLQAKLDNARRVGGTHNIANKRSKL